MNIRWSRILLAVTGVLALVAGPAAGQSARKVLILPFTINAEKDLSFLQRGIQDMLTTRLAQPGDVEPMGREAGEQAASGVSEINNPTAVSLGKRLDADYVVFGSLTLFGSGVSTDARVVDVDAGKAVYTFNETGGSEGDVINHVNRFAAEANRQVFGRDAGVGNQTAAAPTRDPVEESRMHPEKLWTGRMTAESEGGEREETSSPGSLWRSQPMRTVIRGLSAGDVDGDGTEELVFVDDRTVHIYRIQNERLLRVDTLKSDVNTRHLAVDVADINGNGRAEIFVTALFEAHRSLRSFVLEWDGQTFKQILTAQPWYLRVLNTPDRGTILVGQRGSPDEHFIGGVDELQYREDGFAAVSPQVLPGWVNIFGFNYGNVTGDGREIVAAFSKRDRLRLVTREGETIWESRDRYGQTTTYVEVPEEAASSIGDYTEMDRQYLPARVLMHDVNGDGQTEVIVPNNEDAVGLFQGMRILKGGHMVALSWDKLGLHPQWRTREAGGYVSDAELYDTDNDGRMELVYAIVRQTDSVITQPRSFVVVQEIQ
ncbi:MAG: FG-GAP-like repeat-containing protein [Desulfococcaceae bacterium]